MRLIDASENKKGVLAPVGRSAVLLVEKEIAARPQIALRTEHKFAPGVYSRWLYIPKDTVLAGRIHKFEHFNLVLTGTIEVMTEWGYKKVSAPAMFKSPAGVKRAGYAHEDTIWITIHPNPTDEPDPKKLEEMLTVPDYAELEKDIIEGEIVK